MGGFELSQCLEKLRHLHRYLELILKLNIPLLGKSNRHIDVDFSTLTIDSGVIKQYHPLEQGDNASNRQHDKLNNLEISAHLAS